MKSLSYKKIRRWAIAMIALGLLVGGMGPAPQASAATLSVCASGCSFSTIQTAIAAATPQDTISIGPGAYVGPIVVTKNLRLIGSGAKLTTIFGGVIAVGLSNVTLEGVTISKGLNGLELRNAAVVNATDIVIAGNAANGVALFGDSALSLISSVITKNGISILGNPIGSGIAARNSARINVFNIVITENGADGISLLDDASANISLLTSISKNGLDGVQLGGRSRATIDSLNSSGNALYGLAIEDNSQATVSGSEFSSNGKAGIHIGGPSSTLVGGSTLTDPPVTATATITSTTVSGNAIGILIGDLSKQRESANVTLRSVLVEKSSVCGVLIDPQAPKIVTMSDMSFSDNAQDKCSS
ncbi:MAG TPA: hypothetical protein ENI60_09040 [Candidatus Fraserbacteria bacterium]|nr:hypothetical protein [Candidatus Fraserbacteria bacterium]